MTKKEKLVNDRFSICIIPDTHFGHKIEGVVDIDEYLFKKWSSVVKPSDKVYHVEFY